MVDTTKLTDAQRYGLLFDMDRENKQIESQNANAVSYNANRPINQPEQPIKELFTLDTFVAKIVTDRADQLFTQLKQYKSQIAFQRFDLIDEEKQAKVLEILGVPDVVQA